MRYAVNSVLVRRLSRAAVVIALAGAALAGGVSVASAATPARPAGWVTVEACDTVNGTMTYNPGITSTPTTQAAFLNTSIDNCSSSFTGPFVGSGTLTATLNGTASTLNLALTGTFQINWPTAANLYPSLGTMAVTGPDPQGVYTLSGTITSGAFTGSPVRTTALIAGGQVSPLTTQRVANVTDLTVSRNNG